MKIKVYFILPTLFAGGAERVMSFVADNLNKEKFEVKLIVIGKESESKFRVTNIPIIFLNKSRVLHGFIAVSRIILSQKPHIVVSCIAHLNIMMGIISTLIKKPIYVGRQAGVPGGLIKFYESRKLNKHKLSLFNYESFGLKQLDYYICQSTDMKNSLMNIYNINNKNIIIINNPITQSKIIKSNPNSKNRLKKYITVGRLSPAKGYIRILNILSRLKFPFHYTIIGEGSFYKSIVEEINRLKLDKKVTIINYSDNIPEFLAESDMFLQGSYSEGFPNALLESCAVGIPVIAFKAPGGTKEIIDNDINGYIVLNEDEFYNKLTINKDWDSDVIRMSVHKKFNKKKIISEYESFFFRILE